MNEFYDAFEQSAVSIKRAALIANVCEGTIRGWINGVKPRKKEGFNNVMKKLI